MEALSLESTLLKVQHLLLEFDPSRGGKTTHFTIGADDSVAGDEQRKGISGQYATYGPACGRPA